MINVGDTDIDKIDSEKILQRMAEDQGFDSVDGLIIDLMGRLWSLKVEKDQQHNEYLRTNAKPKKELKIVTLETQIKEVYQVTERETMYVDVLIPTSWTGPNLMPWPATPTYRTEKRENYQRYTVLSLAKNDTPVRTLKIKDRNDLKVGDNIRTRLLEGELMFEKTILSKPEGHYIERGLQETEYTTDIQKI